MIYVAGPGRSVPCTMFAFGPTLSPLREDADVLHGSPTLHSVGRNQLPESCAAANVRNVEARKRAETDAVLKMVAAVPGFIVDVTTSLKEVIYKQCYATVQGRTKPW